MIKIRIKKQPAYAINTRKLRKELTSYLEKRGIVSDTEVSISFVSSRSMIDLAEKHLGEKRGEHSVLSFPIQEKAEGFVFPPNETIYLGDIVISYPKVQEEANREGKLIDDKALELVLHGADHLMGIHHE